MKLPLNQVLCGDCREVMASLPEESIDLVVTSPPYWGLRDYGNSPQVFGGNSECDHQWGEEIILPKKSGGTDSSTLGEESWGNAMSDEAMVRSIKRSFVDESKSSFCVKCGAWRGQLGLEPHPQMFIDHLVEVSREIKRIIKPRGSFWLNLGDTYCGSGKGRGSGDWIKDSKNLYSDPDVTHPKPIKLEKTNWLQPKQLLGIPWRVAIALQNDGWILRNCVIWYKPNHMPESVKDRLTKSYEFMFFFVKQRKYYFNLDRIREPYAESSIKRITQPTIMQQRGGDKQHELYGDAPGHGNRPADILKGLAEKLTKHEVATGRIGNFSYDDPLHNKAYHPKGKNPGDMWDIPTYPFPGAHFAVFPPALIEPIIKAACPKNGVVLDPFAGSGTALRVARKLGRQFIGIDINPEYVGMSKRRVKADSYSPPPEGVPALTEMFDRE